MRVVHLSIYDRVGGACIAAYRQHLALKQKNVDSRMWVLSKVSGDIGVDSFTPQPHLRSRFGRAYRRWQIRSSHHKAKIRGEFFDFRSEYGKESIENMPSADILNVQFPHNFLDLPTLYSRVEKSVPIVVTLHEMSPFTGGCSYAFNCDRYKSSCGICPQIGSNGLNDLSARNWQMRKSAYAERLPGLLHFVADSHWIAKCASESGLLNGLPISVIHYGVDLDVFKPIDKKLARSVLGIGPNVPVIGFAAASVDNARKGIAHLDQAMRKMASRPIVVTWGSGYPQILNSFQHLHLGEVSDERLIALAYNAIDLFVMPSLEEAFGQTALESIACQTPVVAFAAGGITDTVRHEQTGLVVDVGDSSGLAAAMERLINDPQLRERLGFAGRVVAEKEFSYDLNATKYIQLYQNLLDSARGTSK